MMPDNAYYQSGGGGSMTDIKKNRRNINMNAGQNIMESKIGGGLGSNPSFKNLKNGRKNFATIESSSNIGGMGGGLGGGIGEGLGGGMSRIG